MLGGLRLLLAMSVAAYHAGWVVDGIYPGIPAVVVFYIVSGYAMAGLWTRGFAARPGRVGAFYRDRILRLAPQYYLWLIVAGVLYYGFGRRYLEQPPLFWPSPLTVSANLVALPLLGMGAYLPIQMALVPPAWSLGVELIFYALLPVLLRTRAALVTAALAGAGVFIAAQFALIDPVAWSYSLFPGTLPFFVLGIAIYRRDWTVLAGLYGLLLIETLTIWHAGFLGIGFNRDIWPGFLFGAPVVLLLTRFRPRRLDTTLGHASYGCYLAHWSVLALLGGPSLLGRPWAVASVPFLAALLGWIAYAGVEAPIARFRRRLRTRADAGPPLPSNALPSVPLG